MLRKLLLSTAMVSMVGSALAADLPARSAPAPYIQAPPIFTWTGFYVGANAGYGMLRSVTKHSGFGSGSGGSGSGYGATAGSRHNNARGVLGGVQIGYNQQFGSIVAGFEADISASSIKGSAFTTGGAASSSSGSGSGSGSTSLRSSSRMSGFGTLRGRLGFAVDRGLFYVTGGLAYAKVSNSLTFGIDTPDWSGSLTAAQSGWKAGWTAGVGVEYALNNHWSLKAESLYFDLGTRKFDVSNLDMNGVGVLVGSVRNTGLLGRIGVNYRF